nr:hypothetical protein [Tanacetum cinerariifolium]
MGMTRETRVNSPTDLPILVPSSPGVPLRATPTQFALLADVDTQECVVELLADKKPGASGRVFAITEDHATKTSGSPITTTERIRETYKNVSQDIRDQLNAEAEAVQIILTGIDNDIYSTVDAFPNTCEMWKAIERLKQSKSINVQDLETNLYWEFRKFTSQDGESL